MEPLHREARPARLRRVAVVRVLPGLGDLLCLVPALRALRAAAPRARITLVGLAGARSFVRRFHAYVDELAECPGFPGLAEQAPAVRRLVPFLRAMQARRLDLALQMHGRGPASNLLTALLGARWTAGFFVPGQYCPDPVRFLPFAEATPESRRHLRLVEHLGIPARGEQLEFPLGPEDVAALRAVPGAWTLPPGRYACVHPGASARGGRWPAERFAAVADALARRGIPVVLTGTADEAVLTARVQAAMAAPALDLAGRTTLGALGVLLRRARLLVCNDTGISHLAAALGVPSVIVFTGADPRRWAPLDGARHRPVAGRPGDGPAALPAIDDVLAEVEQVLAAESACLPCAS